MNALCIGLDDEICAAMPILGAQDITINQVVETGRLALAHHQLSRYNIRNVSISQDLPNHTTAKLALISPFRSCRPGVIRELWAKSIDWSTMNSVPVWPIGTAARSFARSREALEFTKTKPCRMEGRTVTHSTVHVPVIAICAVGAETQSAVFRLHIQLRAELEAKCIRVSGFSTSPFAELVGMPQLGDEAGICEELPFENTDLAKLNSVLRHGIAEHDADVALCSYTNPLYYKRCGAKREGASVALYSQENGLYGIRWLVGVAPDIVVLVSHIDDLNARVIQAKHLVEGLTDCSTVAIVHTGQCSRVSGIETSEAICLDDMDSLQCVPYADTVADILQAPVLDIRSPDCCTRVVERMISLCK